MHESRYDELIHQGLEAYENFRGLRTPCESLPVLDEFCSLHHADLDFSDCEVLFIQHLLGPTLARLNAMWNHGLAKERTWFVDIPYSTHEPLRQLLMERGVPVDQIARPFEDPLVAYSTAQKLRVAEVLGRMTQRRTAQRVLVVDDGAYFARVMHVMRRVSPQVFRAFSGRTVIVEQTTRGHRYLHQKRYQPTLEALEVSAVSIARCDTKSCFEGPFIGQAVARQIQELLGAGTTGLGRVALLGFGTVGGATFRRLRGDTDEPIDVVDPDVSKHAEIHDEGGRPHPSLPATRRSCGWRKFSVE